MFQPRQLLKRSSGIETASAKSPAKVQGTGKSPARHPAMRGLEVSSVHGRHCICARCEQRRNTA